MTFTLHRNVYLNDTHYQWQFTDELGQQLVATNSYEHAMLLAYETVSHGHLLVDEKGNKINHV